MAKDDDGSDKDNETKVPDGGWGWVIVFGAFVLNFLIGGAVNTFGVLYIGLIDLYHQSASTTAWVGSLANAMGLLLGPMASALSSRFSCRTVVFVGGIITSAGWISSAFVPRLEFMFLTYGILAGFGKSLAYTCSVIMVGLWFDKRRSLANGITVAGAGCGTFAFAPLLEMLLTEYNVSGTMLIMGGVMLNISAFGLLFRSVPINNRKSVTIYNVSSDISNPVTESQNNNVSSKSSNTVSSDNCIQTTGTPLTDMGMAYQTNTLYNKDIVLRVPTITQHENVPNTIMKPNRTENKDKDKNSKTMKEYLDYTLLKEPNFLFFGISVLFATLGHSPAAVMLPSIAIEMGIPPQEAAYLLSIMGMADLIGRLVFGAISDTKFFKNIRTYLYITSLFISGISTITCTFVTSYVQFAAYSVIFGLFAGSYNALTPVILVDLLGAKKLSSAFGLALFFQGFGFLLGTPIAGWLKDETGHYQASFYFAGASMVMSSLVINIPTFRKLICTRTKKVEGECNNKQVYEDNAGFNNMETDTSCRL